MHLFDRFFGAGMSGAVCFGLLLIGAAHAQEIPCSDELRTFCADVRPGGGRLLQCLKRNEAKLSAICTQRVNDLQKFVSGPMGACRDDWAALCYHPRASTGRQEMVQCLQANRAKLSAGCQKALQGGSGKRQHPGGVVP